MPSLLDTMRSLFAPQAKPVPSGTYSYTSPPNDPRNYRLHLRIEPDGGGLLIVNAATVLHLNQTAAEYAYYMVQNLGPDQAVEQIVRRYSVDRAQARQDYTEFLERIQTLINTPDLDPVTFLDFERQEPFSGHITAPYRLDIALTYRLPESLDAGDAPADRTEKELTTAEWKQVIEKAWQAGIPHLVFTGGEATLRPDLPELLAYAEEKNQVTGLLSDGQRLTDLNYLETLLQTGLDHLLLLFSPEDASDWQALRNALAADLFTAVHVTLTKENQTEIPGFLERLAEMGVHAISLSVSDAELDSVLQDAYDHAAHLNMELVWNLPVPYSMHNPIAFETGTTEYQRGAGRAWMYVEPDGDVLPAQGQNNVLGNLLTDSWEKIWQAR